MNRQSQKIVNRAVLNLAFGTQTGFSLGMEEYAAQEMGGLVVQIHAAFRKLLCLEVGKALKGECPEKLKALTQNYISSSTPQNHSANADYPLTRRKIPLPEVDPLCNLHLVPHCGRLR